jgi:hypothetical protein
VNSVNGHKPLRFGVLCNSTELQHWEFVTIQKLVEKGYAIPVVFVINSKTEPKRGVLERIKQFRFSRLLWRVMERKFRNIPALQAVELTEHWPDVHRHFAKTVLMGTYSEYFQDKDIELIRSCQPDFLLRFGFNILRGTILNLSRYGVWSFHHADELKYRGGPGAFWEIFFNDAATSAILQQLTDKLDGGNILRKGSIRTISHSYSANLNQLLYAFTEFPALTAAEIVLNEGKLISAYPSATKAPVYKYPPTNKYVLKVMFRSVMNKFSFHYKDIIWAEKWNIGTFSISFDELLSGKQPAIEWKKPLKRGHYLADPFGLTKNTLLVESFSYRKKKGELAILSENNELKTCCKDSIHHSFPFIFKVGREAYLIPEQYQSEHSYFYSMGGNEAKREGVLLSGFSVVDPVVHKHHDKYFLFATSAQHPDTHLHLFYSDEPLKGFREHPLSPVRIDIDGARMAGSIIEHNGELYRLGQSSARSYGEGIIIYIITALSEKIYTEVEVSRIHPDAGSEFNKGIHTLNRWGDCYVTDGKTYEFVWSHTKEKIRKRLHKLLPA